jgi:hypothetical protein
MGGARDGPGTRGGVDANGSWRVAGRSVSSASQCLGLAEHAVGTVSTIWSILVLTRTASVGLWK